MKLPEAIYMTLKISRKLNTLRRSSFLRLYSSIEKFKTLYVSLENSELFFWSMIQLKMKTLSRLRL